MKKIIYLLVISFVCISCSSSDDSNDGNQNPQNSFVSATINGESFMTNNNIIGATGLFFEFGNTYGFSIGGARIDENFDGVTLAVSFGGEDFDLVDNGTEYSSGLNSQSVLGNYAVTENGQEVINADSDEFSGYVKITFIDKENRVISGEFSFIAVDDQNVTYDISDGVFSNIEYTVQ